MKKGISTKKIHKLFVIFLILDHNLLSFSVFFFLVAFCASNWFYYQSKTSPTLKSQGKKSNNQSLLVWLEKPIEKWKKKCTLIDFDFFPRLFRVLVKAAFVPSIWVPPSIVRMLLAYPSIVSEYASEHLVENKWINNQIIKYKNDHQQFA